MNMNPFEMLKQMGNINSQMEQIKADMEKLRATGSAGAGMVEVSINGVYQVQSVKIAPEMLKLSDDPKTLEVFITSAFNDATSKIKTSIEDMTKSKLSGMGINP